MKEEAVRRAKKIAEDIAASCGTPRFYREHLGEVGQSQDLFDSDPAVRRGLSIITGGPYSYGHGLSHARKVAVDAGAIILIEEPPSAGNRARLLTLAHLAGLFHDISRSSPSHAEAGAIKAEAILADFNLTASERTTIVEAIRNHEAFQTATTLSDPSMQILSDALYDADKFRWGPDNFTEMLWDIALPLDIPLGKMLAHFLPGLEGVARIRNTFRSDTGKEYGPDFIDRGLVIGRKLYDELIKLDLPE